MTFDLGRALALARRDRAAAVDQLAELVAIPSVSADPARAGDVRAAADWLAAELEGLGLGVSRHDAGRHPVVVAEHEAAPGAPTVAFYSHYDVQPVEPLAAWTTPPFEAVVEDGAIRGRGVRDDKGQLVAILRAVRYALAAGGPPVNLRLFLDGEEEIAGTSLATLLREQPGRWPADAAVVVDGQFAAPGRPTIVSGVRGLLAFALEAQGAREDLHSGGFGGAAPNPLQALAHVLSELKPRDGRIALPGFYADVAPPTARERRDWTTLALTDAGMAEAAGARALDGEAGHTALERVWSRPSLDVHGISGGHAGPGLKTVIPATARATASFRLVPAQRPDVVWEALRARVGALAPPGVELAVQRLASSEPMAFDVDGPTAGALRAALEQTFAAAAVATRLGASMPVATALRDHLTPNVLMVGFGLPGDGPHSPREHLALAQFHGASEALLRFLAQLAR